MPGSPSPLFFQLSQGPRLPLFIHRHPRSRKLSLRLTPCGRGLKVVAPYLVTRVEILDFLARHEDWISRKIDIPSHSPQGVKSKPPTILYKGREYTLVCRKTAERPKGTAKGRGGPLIDNQSMIFFCSPKELIKATGKFLRRTAKEEIIPKAHALAHRIGRQVQKIYIKDTKTRWGSCSSLGNLSFSWRLVMAPQTVLDYVVVHEVAHLEHFNHSRDFWLLVESLTPHRQEAERWLQSNARRLHVQLAIP